MRSRTILLVLAVTACVAAVSLSLSTIMTQYDDAVHRKNSTEAGTCLQVSQKKAEAARISVAAAITLNTIAIGIAILAAARFASCICSCATLPESCKRACNWILVALYVSLVVIVCFTLLHVDPSCRKMALALLMLLVIVPITCCPIWCIARGAQNAQHSNEHHLLDDIDLE